MNASDKGVHRPTKDVITIVLADDHTMMREGTRRLLEEDPAFVVVGEACDGSEAVALCQQFQPDVLVLDIAMKGMNGFGVARTLLVELHSSTEILVLTGYTQAAYVEMMLSLEVKGYWLKSASSNDIRQAMHAVAAGRRSFDPEIRQIIKEEKYMIHSIKSLTTREQDVLEQLAQGLRNSEISERLHISVKTVETHLTNLYNKLGLQSRAEAVAFAKTQGLLLFDV